MRTSVETGHSSTTQRVGGGVYIPLPGAQGMDLLFATCVTLDELLNLSEPPTISP